MINPAKIRAARSLLGMRQHELAELASLSVVTLKRLEAAGTEIKGSARTFNKLQQALEDSGIIFIDQDDKHGPGVRMRDPAPR